MEFQTIYNFTRLSQSLSPIGRVYTGNKVLLAEQKAQMTWCKKLKLNFIEGTHLYNKQMQDFSITLESNIIAATQKRWNASYLKLSVTFIVSLSLLLWFNLYFSRQSHLHASLPLCVWHSWCSQCTLCAVLWHQ